MSSFSINGFNRSLKQMCFYGKKILKNIFKCQETCECGVMETRDPSTLLPGYCLSSEPGGLTRETGE